MATSAKTQMVALANTKKDVHMVNGQQLILHLGALLLRVRLARTAVKAQRSIALMACTVYQALLNILNAQ